MTNARARRWLTWAVVALIAAIACVLLGRWQYDRYETKSRAAALIEANYDAAPAALDDVLTRGFDPRSEWAPVEITGHFVGTPVTLPQRGIQGTAGDHVIGIFQLDPPSPGDAGDDEPDAPGRAILIDRGWYPVSHAPADMSPPDGTHTLVGRVRPGEPASPRGIRDHEVFAIDPEQVLQAQGLTPVGDPATPGTPTLGDGAVIIEDIYLMYAADVSGPDGQLGTFPPPTFKTGSHLSYSLQWWVFGAGALVGLGIVISRDLRAERGEAPKPKRQRLDDSEEDALIDAQTNTPPAP